MFSHLVSRRITHWELSCCVDSHFARPLMHNMADNLTRGTKAVEEGFEDRLKRG